MDISLKSRTYVMTLTIQSGNATISEDLSEGKEVEEMIEKLITVANELSRFNDNSDVRFVKTIYDLFLTDCEQTEFIELINEKSQN